MMLQRVRTKVCPFCGESTRLLVPKRGYEQWLRGKHIQQAMPEVSPGDRERLISGTCSPCWDREMGEEVEA